VQGRVTHYPLPTSIALPYGITIGADRNVWFTEQHTGKIGRLVRDPSE